MLYQQDEVKLICVLSPKGTDTAKETFDRLEENLPTMKGRRFYGLFRVVDGKERYLACTRIEEGDDPNTPGLTRETLHAGKYDREKIEDWEGKLDTLPEVFTRIESRNSVDESRWHVEYYRSMKELYLMVPVE